MPNDDLPRWDEPGFWTARGCVMLAGVSVSVLGIAAAVYYAVEGYTDGLLLVIACLLAVLLLVQATKR